VEELTAKEAFTPLKVTTVAPVKLAPEITTEVPTTPLVGVKLLIVGATIKVKLVELMPEPAGVVTPIGPVVMPAGTKVVIWVAELTAKFVALTPLKVTAVVPLKFAPVMTTEVPVTPLVGVKLLMLGAGKVTTKLVVLVTVPPGAVTTINPLPAPAGTVAVIWVAEFTVKLAFTPLKATAVAPVKLVPVSTTAVPTVPLLGVKLVRVSTDKVTVKELELVAVPPLVVTAIAPLVAPVGTVAVIWVDELTA
jgi:hypothetical protein